MPNFYSVGLYSLVLPRVADGGNVVIAFVPGTQAQTSPRLSRPLLEGRADEFGGEVGGTIGKITGGVKGKCGILLTNELCNFSEWTPEKVKERQLRLAKLAAEVWSFDIK